MVAIQNLYDFIGFKGISTPRVREELSIHPVPSVRFPLVFM